MEIREKNASDVSNFLTAACQSKNSLLLELKIIAIIKKRELNFLSDYQEDKIESSAN